MWIRVLLSIYSVIQCCYTSKFITCLDDRKVRRKISNPERTGVLEGDVTVSK